MRRLLILLPLFALLVASDGPAAPVPADAVGPVYFPISVGTRMVWEREDLPGRPFETVVTSVEKQGRAWLVTVGSGKDAEVTRVSESGLELVAMGESVFDPPRRILKVPVGEGTKWSWHVGNENGRILAESTAKADAVEVSAGRFKAVRVDMTVRIGKAGKEEFKSRRECWYVVGMGEVKRVEIDKFGGRRSVQVLKSFTSGRSERIRRESPIQDRAGAQESLAEAVRRLEKDREGRNC